MDVCTPLSYIADIHFEMHHKKGNAYAEQYFTFIYIYNNFNKLLFQSNKNIDIFNYKKIILPIEYTIFMQ